MGFRGKGYILIRALHDQVVLDFFRSPESLGNFPLYDLSGTG